MEYGGIIGDLRVETLVKSMEDFTWSFILWVSLNLMNIWLLRMLIFSFLEGCVGRRHAAKVRKEYSIFQRLRFNYIKPYLTRHQKLFSFYRIFYLLVCFSLPVLSVAFLCLRRIYGTAIWLSHIVEINTVIAFVIFVVLRTKFSMSWAPKYWDR